MKIRIITFDKNSIFNLKVDEEKKVDAVRDFYAEAAENKVAFASAERMLFLGKFICFDLLMDLMMDLLMDLMMDPKMNLLMDLMMDPKMDLMMDLIKGTYDFSSSWSACLYPSLQCHLLGIRTHDVHGGQLENTCGTFNKEAASVKIACKLFPSHSPHGTRR